MFIVNELGCRARLSTRTLISCYTLVVLRLIKDRGLVILNEVVIAGLKGTIVNSITTLTC